MKTHFPNRERGAVLIVALLFLVMLTLLGVTAMTGTTMEERMAGNARDQSVAFQAAEAALRDARRDLDCYPNPTGCALAHPARGLPADWPLTISNFGVNLVTGTCNNGGGLRGLCLPAIYVGGENAQLPSVPAGHSFTAAPSVAYGTFTGAPALVGVSIQPTYLIELFRLVCSSEGLSGDPCTFFRITAVGYGASPNTVVRLQEIIQASPV